jgi:hypothetical protein
MSWPTEIEWLYIIVGFNWAFTLFILSDIAAELRTLNSSVNRLSNSSKD